MARSHSNEEQNVRLLKVGERVRHVLSEILMRGQVHDETISAHNVSVTEVRMSSDMRIAKVFVKPLLGEDEDAVLTALQQNTAYFQREVANALKLKYAAKLRFLVDDSFDEANRIEQLLNDPLVARDLKSEEE
ncbi:30S ribosome-binding factor RbfA [Altererythrobacter indicus]|uniref:Ribosome-binding factor A n=1 Tax=Altericroceibacterium indicum TaxID=374177 RepID=A0A845A7P7_9SPHN|nr:30S ribosome-binding factor RbfA [Altericroceibacterium indicum]MXP25547.1 30S ribosome-binding factor RbfA [Altericroceibacterium indicum]